MPTNAGPQVGATYTLASGHAVDAGVIPALTIAALQSAYLGTTNQSGLTPPQAASGPPAAPVTGDAVAVTSGSTVALTGNYPVDVALVTQATMFSFALSVSGTVVYTPWAEYDIAPPSAGVAAQLAAILADEAATQSTEATLQAGVSSVQGSVAAVQGTVSAIQAAPAITDAAIRADIAAEMGALGLSPTSIAAAIAGGTVDGPITRRQSEELALSYAFGLWSKAISGNQQVITFRNQAGQVICTSTDTMVNGAPAGRASVVFTNLGS